MSVASIQDHFVFHFPPKCEYLSCLGSFVGSLVENDARLPKHDQVRFNLDLVLNESCNNVMKHSQKDTPVHLEIFLDETGIEILVFDKGEGFVWPEIYGFETQEYPEGGFGLYLMKELMDEVNYESLSEHHHVLKMRKSYQNMRKQWK